MNAPLFQVAVVGIGHAAQDRRTYLVLPPRAKQEAKDQTGKDSIMSQAQFFNDVNRRRCVRGRGPRYYSEEHAEPRMDAPRNHVHQLHRRSVPEDAEELDLAADYIQLGLGHWISRSVIERQNWHARYSVLHGDHY